MSLNEHYTFSEYSAMNFNFGMLDKMLQSRKHCLYTNMATALKFSNLFFNSFRKPANLTVMSKSIATTAQRLNETVEELKSNPYFDKYSDKIAKLQNTSPDEFLSRVERHKEAKTPKPSQTKDQRPISPGAAKPFIESGPQLVKTKQLKNYMKTDMLADKPREEIEKIWIEHHKNKDVLAAVIPKETYAIMHERGKEFNTFLLPLPRNQGYEFIVCQFYGHEVHFTPLIAYQTHKENAPECLCLVHYTEFAEDKGIVLMKGDYNTDILQSHEAQCLINELQLYYTQNNEKRMKMLRRFTYAPEEFKHMDLIADMECLTI